MTEPALRVGYAITILRQGKSHPRWREAAHYLLEHAAKDTQLLLDAQRELLLADNRPEISRRLPWRAGLLVLAAVLIAGGVLFLLYQWRVLCIA